ncbi:MAG TPA: YggS family pyridoxal phosphate-dependent enzyme [Candidatus Limnocylindrales bacterium]|nr:YggS family pyridoxal phosphate-dependent enzyme [Candidatus Limnocylindrales bacterium]
MSPPDEATAVDPRDVAAIADARDHVHRRIADACARVGRDPGSVALVAVSKTVPVERLRAAVAAGLTTLGENRVQEAEQKIADVPGARWHLIGPLQSNKARRALAAFAVIESVDSVELAVRLDRLAAEARPQERVPVFLQVNVDGDPAKAGFAPAALVAVAELIAALPRLEIRGLMTVGRLVPRPEDARPTFVALRVLAERLRAGVGSGGSGGPAWLGPELSMGMSDDFEIAVQEGATVVRIGRALFGHRH